MGTARHGAQRRGWEDRSHPEPRAALLQGEHGEDGEDRTFPAASTVAPSAIETKGSREPDITLSDLPATHIQFLDMLSLPKAPMVHGLCQTTLDGRASPAP
jgi:hypothetical protein